MAKQERERRGREGGREGEGKMEGERGGWGGRERERRREGGNKRFFLEGNTLQNKKINTL